MPAENQPIPLRNFGSTGAKISALGLGGQHLGDPEVSANATAAIVHEAVDCDITFFDNCWECHLGKTEDWMAWRSRASATRSFS